MRGWRALVVLLGVCGVASWGGPRAAGPAGETVVVLVRHAEKLPGEDPGLDEAGAARARALAHTLSAWRPQAIYVSQFRRTRDTAGPLAEATGLAPVALNGLDIPGLVARIREGEATRVVVVGHSNTIPAVIAALGAPRPDDIGEEVYDDLFVVTLPADGGAPGLLHLKYGAPTPG